MMQSGWQDPFDANKRGRNSLAGFGREYCHLAEAAFMNEPRFQHNHRANILNANYTDVGIGIVQGANGSLYITQDFVKLPANSGGVTSAPRPTYRPEPGYTPAAGKAKIEGGGCAFACH